MRGALCEANCLMNVAELGFRVNTGARDSRGSAATARLHRDGMLLDSRAAMRNSTSFIALRASRSGVRAARPHGFVALAAIGVTGLLAAGCAGGGTPSVASAARADVPGDALGDGRVRLRAETMPFIGIEQVAAPERGSVLVAPGRVAFRDGARASVGAPADGRVVEVHVTAGGLVRRGDPLVTLSSPAAAAQRAELQRLQAAHRAARDAAARHARMMESGVGVAAERLAADSHLAEVEAELASARRAVAYLGEGEGETVVVRAPIDGTVIELGTSVGASASPGNGPLVEVGDPDAVWLVADVFERDLALVEEGAPALVETAASSEPIRGRVARVGAALRSGMRAAPVYVEFEDATVRLRAGTYARVTIDSNSPAGVLLPSAAVLIQNGVRPVVYVETAERTFAAREVRIGASIDSRVNVLSGLEPGERVVVRGALLLDGAADQLL